MTVDSLGEEIEVTSLRAWPALEEVDFDGWTLRFSEGFTGRANSVQALGTSSRSMGDRVGHCERWYEERARPSLFRLTPFSEPGLDDFLASRGYERFNATVVLHREADGLPPRSTDIELLETQLHEWLRRYARFTGSPAAPEPMRRIIERIEVDALPGLLRTIRPKRFVACGLAVLDGPFLGLFDLVVDPAERRRGYGDELVRQLAAWGVERRARRVYLQVTVDNAAALALYRKLGFEPAYEYWYRIRPS